MTRKNEKYPNKQDYALKMMHPRKGVIFLEELPLADPSTSNSTDIFVKNARKQVNDDQPSAYGINKTRSEGSPKTVLPSGKSTFIDYATNEKAFNKSAHDKWNAHKAKQISVEWDA